MYTDMLNDTEDIALLLRRQLQQVIQAGEKHLELEGGTYHVYGDYLPDVHCDISNNDSGLKRVLFDLSQVESTEKRLKDKIFISHGAHRQKFNE